MTSFRRQFALRITKRIRTRKDRKTNLQHPPRLGKWRRADRRTAAVRQWIGFPRGYMEDSLGTSEKVQRSRPQFRAGHPEGRADLEAPTPKTQLGTW